MAKEEAKEAVKKQYGKNLFFTVRMALEKKAYTSLRETKEQYQPLLINKVDYFYKKYATDGTYQGEGNFKVEFFQKFVNHRKEEANENLGKHLKVVTGDFLNDIILLKIIEGLFVLMFENDSYQVFKEKLAKMIQEAKNANDDEIGRIVDDGMDFLPAK
jgi:hypothetical protein